MVTDPATALREANRVGSLQPAILITYAAALAAARKATVELLPVDPEKPAELTQYRC